MPHTALRRHRIAKGLTQVQVARIAGVTQPAIVNYEQGRNFPADIEVQRALRSLFGVPLPVLFAPENGNGDLQEAAAASGGPIANASPDSTKSSGAASALAERPAAAVGDEPTVEGALETHDCSTAA
jgi:transcriptional regulator with XRE-family HTH domain